MHALSALMHNDLAMAMEARCYHGGEGRTRMKPLKYNGRDKAAYLITILYAAGDVYKRQLPVQK